jgi:hypothetical protein
MTTFALEASAHRCEDASALSADRYIPCNRPARKVVLADGNELRMCDECAWHSQKNRAMKIVRDYGSVEGEVALPLPSNHNNPPDPIDAICATYEPWRTEAENWTDGSPVETEPQMRSVDALRAQMRRWRLDLEAGQKSEAAPLHDAWKAALARWKPTIEDAQRYEKCLNAAVEAFKLKLKAEKEEAERKARAEADRKMREAAEAARRASDADLDAQRAVAAAQAEAEAAQIAAVAAAKDAGSIKGLRKTWRYEITDHRALLHWLAVHRKDALTEWIEEYARRHHKDMIGADGLNVWPVEEAF